VVGGFDRGAEQNYMLLRASCRFLRVETDGDLLKMYSVV
jgi:hypothetical protein